MNRDFVYKKLVLFLLEMSFYGINSRFFGENSYDFCLIIVLFSDKLVVNLKLEVK